MSEICRQCSTHLIHFSACCPICLLSNPSIDEVGLESGGPVGGAWTKHEVYWRAFRRQDSRELRERAFATVRST